MNDALDVELTDPEAVDEIRLVTELMVVASMAPGDLEQRVIDEALGLSSGGDSLPGQRRPPA